MGHVVVGSESNTKERRSDTGRRNTNEKREL